ncbi:MAG: substrate-binding domain-containing protein, partial [Candidatus Angelobacter sp.]
QFTNPPLTTIRLSRDELGQKAFDALYDAVENPKDNSRQINVSTSLTIRESTARAAVKRDEMNVPIF